MERRDIGVRLRAEAPGAVRAPEGVRGRIESAVGASGPGRERVPGGTSGGLRAGAALVVALAAGAWVYVGVPGAAPGGAGPAAGGGVAVIPRLGDPPPVLKVSSDPLADEARRVWQDLNRLRATVEGPVRSLHELGKSL